MLPIHRYHRDKRQVVAELPLSADDFCSGEEPTTTFSISNTYFLACRLKLNDCFGSNGGIDASNPCCLSVVTTINAFCGETVDTFLGECLNYIVELYTSTLACGATDTSKFSCVYILVKIFRKYPKNLQNFT